MHRRLLGLFNRCPPQSWSVDVANTKWLLQLYLQHGCSGNCASISVWSNWHSLQIKEQPCWWRIPSQIRSSYWGYQPKQQDCSFHFHHIFLPSSPSFCSSARVSSRLASSLVGSQHSVRGSWLKLQVADKTLWWSFEQQIGTAEWCDNTHNFWSLLLSDRLRIQWAG